MKTWTFPLLIVIISALVGCTPSVEVTPTPSEPETSVIVTPTPAWTEDEQGAVDAVQRFLEMWSYIGQNILEADWMDILQVAVPPESELNQETWTNWLTQGWHLEGSPIFIVSRVEIGVLNSSGQWYYVHGCYVIEESYISDKDGKSVGDEGRQERGLGYYKVFRVESGAYYVGESHSVEGTC